VGTKRIWTLGKEICGSRLATENAGKVDPKREQNRPLGARTVSGQCLKKNVGNAKAELGLIRTGKTLNQKRVGG